MRKRKLLASDKSVLSIEQLNLIKGGANSGAPGAGINVLVRGQGSLSSNNG